MTEIDHVNQPNIKRKRVSEISFPLKGPAGEKIDLWRTLMSHGMSSLPPMSLDEGARTLETTLSLNGRRPRRIRLAQRKPGYGSVHVFGPPLSQKAARALLSKLSHILRLVRHRADGKCIVRASR